jgi:hypothetical protein
LPEDSRLRVPPDPEDTELRDDVVLWRRLLPGKLTGKGMPAGQVRPDSDNFWDREQQLSMFVSHETDEDTLLEGHEGYGIGEFTVGALRGLRLDIFREPDGPGHVVVTPYPSKGVRRELSYLCRIRTFPRPPDETE